MERNTVIRDIDAIVREVGHIGEDDPDLGPESQLLDEGFVDSLNLVTIVLRLEERYAVKFSDADMAGGRFTTINGLADLVCGKLAA